MRQIGVADRDLRHWIYAEIVRTGSVPSLTAMAEDRHASVESIAESVRRLADAHAFALVPGSGEIWMAHPFSSVPTPYAVTTSTKTYWANCAWDAVAIPALLGGDARVDARCPDCSMPIHFEFAAGELEDSDGVVHFAVPPREFWRNIGYT